MGDKIGGQMIAGWDWLWQIPSEPSPETGKTSNDITLEHATQLLGSLTLRVTQMQKVVDHPQRVRLRVRVRSIAREIQRQYELKCQEHQELIGIALEYQRSNDPVEARLTMAKAIGITSGRLCQRTNFARIKSAPRTRSGNVDECE